MSVPDAEFFRLVRAASTLEVRMELRRFAALDSIFPVTFGGICMNSGPLLLNTVRFQEDCSFFHWVDDWFAGVRFYHCIVY